MNSNLDKLTKEKSLKELKAEYDFQISKGQFEYGTICFHIRSVAKKRKHTRLITKDLKVTVRVTREKGTSYKFINMDVVIPKGTKVLLDGAYFVFSNELRPFVYPNKPGFAFFRQYVKLEDTHILKEV